MLCLVSAFTLSLTLSCASLGVPGGTPDRGGCHPDVSDGGDRLRLELPAVQLVGLLVDQPVIDGLLRGRLVAVLAL